MKTGVLGTLLLLFSFTCSGQESIKADVIDICVIDVTKENIQSTADILIITYLIILNEYQNFNFTSCEYNWSIRESSFQNASIDRKSDCETQQCLQYTVNKERCNRKTTNCSGRCWQHD